MMDSPGRGWKLGRLYLHGYTEAVLMVARKGREHRWEVHQQRVGLIRQLEGDDPPSQSLGLTELSAEQRGAT